MNRGLKIGLISLGIIAIPTAIYFIWFRKKGEGKIKGNVDGTLEEKKEKKEIVKKEKKSNPKRYTTESRPLKKYDFGNNVKCLQKLLNWRGYTDNRGKVLVVDGKWGNSTEQALDKSITDGVQWGITKGTGGITVSTLKNRVADTPGVQKPVPLVGTDYLKDTVECKSASCCASVVQVNPVEDDLDNDIFEENYIPNYPQYTDPLLTNYVHPVAIDSTYVHIEPNLYTNFGGLWFDKKNELI